MKALVFDGDIRYTQVITFLRKLGYEVDMFSSTEGIDLSIYSVIVLPILGITMEDLTKDNLTIDFLNNAKENVILFSGIKTDILTKMLEYSKKECIYFMDDEQIARQNAIPTVEGIIADLIINTDITINDSNVMVLGYGKIGKPLVKVLDNLGANIYTGIIEEADKKNLDKNNFKNFYTNTQEINDYVSIMDMIVNTVPKQILTKENLQSMKKNVYILDIASKPYGIIPNELEMLGIKHKIYSAIPSSVAPNTAGKILVRKINSIIGGRK